MLRFRETLCESGRWIDALKKGGRVLKKRGRVLKKRGRLLRRGGGVLKKPVEVLKEFDPLPSTLSVSP